MMTLNKGAAWAASLRRIKALAKSYPGAVRQATLREAQHLRTMIIDGITSQAPGDEAPMRALSLLTLAGRRVRGFHGTKALLSRGDLRNSISVVGKGLTAFVGVLRRARTSDGRSTVDLAEVHEFGTTPTIIPITPKMRRFLAVLLAEAGVPKRHPGQAGKPYIVVRIPARPFMRPAARKFQVCAAARFARHLWAGVNRDDKEST